MVVWSSGERDAAAGNLLTGTSCWAYALGGEVGDNPNGRECGLTSPIQVQVSHIQSVLRLPEGASLLASSLLRTPVLRRRSTISSDMEKSIARTFIRSRRSSAPFW